MDLYGYIYIYMYICVVSSLQSRPEFAPGSLIVLGYLPSRLAKADPGDFFALELGRPILFLTQYSELALGDSVPLHVNDCKPISCLGKSEEELGFEWNCCSPSRRFPLDSEDQVTGEWNKPGSTRQSPAMGQNWKQQHAL